MGCCAARPDFDESDSYDLEQAQSTNLGEGMSPRTEVDPQRQDYCRLCEVKAQHLSTIYAMNASIGNHVGQPRCVATNQGADN